jgi:hypothetical protein
LENYDLESSNGHTELVERMKKNTFFIFVAYIWTKTLLGLTFHPFSTIRQVTRRPVLLPVIFSPLIGLFTLFVLGRIAALLITVYGLSRELIALGLSVALIAIVFWQLLLIYLLASFIVAFWRR